MAAPKGNQYAKGNPTSGAPKIYTPEFIERIAKDMLVWVEKPNSMFIEQFIGDHKEFVDMRLFSEWSKQNVVFSEAYNKVKKKLVGKLKLGSASKTYDGNFVAKVLPLVDEDYRAWRREELQLEKEAKAEMLTQIVDYSKAKSKDG